MRFLLVPAELVLLALATASAEDVKTLAGREYKEATITRAEPDGIVVSYSSGSSRFLSPS